MLGKGAKNREQTSGEKWQHCYPLNNTYHHSITASTTVNTPTPILSTSSSTSITIAILSSHL